MSILRFKPKIEKHEPPLTDEEVKNIMNNSIENKKYNNIYNKRQELIAKKALIENNWNLYKAILKWILYGE